MNLAKNLVTIEVGYGPKALKLMTGYFCLYKPPNKGFKKTQWALRQKLTHELNSMEVRPPSERVALTGDIKSGLQVSMETNLADTVLVSGPRHREEFLQLWTYNNPGNYASGLVLGAIGPRTAILKKNLIKHAFPRIYELKGRFGFATTDFRDTGKVVAKSTYRHIRKEKFEHVLCKIEAAQRENMLKFSGVGMDTEDAYKIASTGWTPPAKRETFPVVYAIRVVDFNLPDFTIELQIANESEAFLAEFVNEIGLAMKSTAMCTGIRLTRFGPFTVDHALLFKDWNLENMIQNTYLCNGVMMKYEESLARKQEKEYQKRIDDKKNAEMLEKNMIKTLD